ncbi:MAG: hypothetical protein H6656_02185 [Ardenticatenaceae bacterium]|nr:hypothetical protein [Ardenticatenaceae bacterium]
MSRLELTTFGVPHIRIDGRIIESLSARKAQALLIYLAITRQQHSRQALAGLLWGEMSEEKARRNLRVTLTRIRVPLEKHLIIRRRSLRMNDVDDVWLDAAEFETCLATATPTLEQLQRAAALYQGHFLDDFVLRDAPLFEEWIRPLQERYRQMAMEAIYRLAKYHTEQKQYSVAITFANRLLLLEPWMEEAHRQLMLLLALSGQRSAALTQYDSCRNMLLEELGVEPTAATIALYEQILREEIQPDTQPIAIETRTPPRAAPIQIPAAVKHFVGRSTEAAAIEKTLCAADSLPVQALVGMGGIGKSSLAIQLARVVQKAFPDGVLWADATSSEPMAILESWAAAYGYDFTRIADLEGMAAAFRGVLAEKRALIVLDDVRSVSRIRPLLPGGEQCKVLLTTRDQDLARALNAQVWPLRELSPENGRLLLSTILGQSRVANETDAADEICTLLQNLPLALEITAQRLKSRPRRQLAEMAQRLRDETQRLSLLKISDREVRVSFAVSWGALDAARQRVFALIGLFNGRSFTAEAMAHIAKMDRFPLEDRLFDLVNLSLLREEDGRRYRQHPLLADFAREQLGEDVGEGYGRFATYYLHFAQQNQHDYDALRPEWDNLMAAMEAAHTHQLWQTVIDFADALHDAWFTRGRFTQARRGLQWAYESAQSQNNLHSVAKFLLLKGQASIKQSDYEIAKDTLTQSLQLYENELTDKSGIVAVKYELAEIAVEQAHFQVAKDLLETCFIICQEHQTGTISIADVLYKLADVEYAQGTTPEEDQSAKQKLLEALQIYEIEGDKEGLVRTLRKLATIATTSEKDFRQAQTYIENALQICTNLADKREHGLLLYNLAGINLYSHLYTHTNSLDQARNHAKQSLNIQIITGDQRSQAQVYWLLSRIELASENFHTAIVNGQDAKRLVDRIRDNSGRIFVRKHLADVFLSMERSMDACKELQEACDIAESSQHPLVNSIQEQLQTLSCQ